jgi:hypothetical protein
MAFDVPYYEQETYAIALATEQECNDWFANEPMKPCAWVKKDKREIKVPAILGTDRLRLVTLVVKSTKIIYIDVKIQSNTKLGFITLTGWSIYTINLV